MIEKFNGIIYLIIFIVHFAAFAFYAFRCLFTTKAFVDQYGMGDGAAIMTRFFGSIFVGSVVMAIYVGFIRPNGLELINDGKDIDYVGVAGDQEIDANGDVSNTIEVWTIENGKVTSTGRFESP